ncbi:MAG: hypothetical protein KC493_00585 [Bacteriovoracaceae bacterium]|nr:hypothetical protein [Bacteriovoracaceae bacterium]
MISEMVVGLDKSLKGNLRDKTQSICERFGCVVEQSPSKRKVDLLISGEKPKSTPLEWGMTIRFSSNEMLESENSFDSTFLLDAEDMFSLEDLLTPISEKIHKGKVEFLVEGSSQKLEEVFKRANSYVGRLYRRMLLLDVNRAELESELTEYLTLQHTTLQLSLNAQTIDDEDDFFTLIMNSIKGHKLIKEMAVIKAEDISGLTKDWDKVIVLPHLDIEDEFLLVKFYPKADSDQANFILGKILQELDNFTFSKERFKGLKTMGELWGQAFNSLPVPAALFKKNGELLLHNSPFSKTRVLPKDCLQFKDNEKVDLGGGVFKVTRKDVYFNEDVYYLFVFDSTDESVNKQNNSSEELGIISSSIAHELNNPIAGILTAISLLELEDDWDDDSVDSLSEMKNGARRCQELIKVFLGFSRASLHQTESGSMAESFQHSINLLRFRMVEANTRLEVVEKSNNTVFRNLGNESIRSMIFYLIMNEVLTSFSHLNLISSEDSKGTKQGEFQESSDEVLITFKQDLQDLSNLKQSKLIKHLLENQSLEMTILPKGIKLQSSAEKLLL